VTQFTFKTEARTLTIEAESLSEAYQEANRVLVPTVPRFYAWMGSGNRFTAATGVWD
jgi:hypothetical protein